jgi:histidinol-phosphate aminotransferase
MSRYWSDLVSQLTLYVPGEQPRRERLVKLNTNENPYPPSPRAMEAIAQVTSDSLRRYPDPESSVLREAFARNASLQPEQVFIGNGSDEVLAHVFQALLKHPLRICFPDVSYSFYPVWCDLYGINYQEVALAEDFSVEVEAYPAENGGIIIPNPNAPTGRLLALDDIRRLLERSSGSVVVIDEAYIDFGGESATPLIDEYNNLLVVQTLSKSRSLAGLRVGVAMGDADLIEGLSRVKNSFNSYPLDTLAQEAALAALDDDAYFQHTCQRVIESRERLAGTLAGLGFEVLPSAANFLFVCHPERPSKELFKGLREHNVIVRYFDSPRIDNYLRITVGTDEECDQLIQSLQEMLAEAASS